MWINTETLEWGLSEQEIRRRFPGASFGQPFVAPEPYAVYFQSPRPVYEPITQWVREVQPTQTGDQWFQAFEVVNFEAEQAQANLESARASKRQAVNAERDRRETAGFPYMGKTLDSDSVSVQRITVVSQAAMAAASAGAPFSIEWTCADDSTLTLDAAGMIGMPAALATYGSALHQHARSLKAQIEAATNSQELAAIDVSAGWPA